MCFCFCCACSDPRSSGKALQTAQLCVYVSAASPCFVLLHTEIIIANPTAENLKNSLCVCKLNDKKQKLQDTCVRLGGGVVKVCAMGENVGDGRV